MNLWPKQGAAAEGRQPARVQKLAVSMQIAAVAPLRVRSTAGSHLLVNGGECV